MDRQLVPEIVARRLADAWAIHRTPAFCDYLLQTFGCEPLKPVGFSGMFCLQMIGGYFSPDLPSEPGPMVKGLWLMDDTGFRPSSMAELRAVENLKSDNPLAVYNPSRASIELIHSYRPWLHAYPRFKFRVTGDSLVYYEEFGFLAGCTKVGRVAVGDRVSIEDVGTTRTTWQGHLKDAS